MAKVDADSLFTRDQVESAKDLHAVIKQLAAEMEALRKAQGSQIEITRQLASAFDEVENSVDETAKKMEKLRLMRLEQFKDEIESASSVTDLAKKAAAHYADEVRNKYPVAFGMAAGAVAGFKQGLTNMTAALKVGVNFAKTLIGTIFSLAGAILSIPFKMFSAIIDIADNAGGGTDELREAIENLRGEYGSLSQETPQAIMKTAKELKGFSDTGLTAFRIFGNMANRLKEVAQLATDMGAVFESFTDEFEQNGGAILAWQRGLGLSGEQMKTIGQRAKTMGTTMSEELMDIQKLSQGMGKDFGIAAKNISKDMATAAANVKVFGGATVKQMGQASVYVRRLGVELEKVVGIMEQYDTFEKAAEASSKAAQAFGIQVDAVKALKAQSPDEIIEMYRQAFARAGRDASKFDRAQGSLLATITNLDAGVAKQIFSLKNQGVSLDKVRASAEKSEKRTLSQAEAMKELADAIKRMIQSGGGDGAKGFFAKFLAGISRGIQSTVAFRTMIWSVRRAMWETRYEGVRLGKALVENFPGMKMFFEGIRGFFARNNFKPLIRDLTNDMISFVKGFSSGKYSFADLMKNLRKRFFDYFNRSSESGRKVIDGFKQMFAAISKIASEAIRWMSSKVRDGIIFITDLITGKRSLGDVSGLGFFANALQPLFEAFKYAWSEIVPVLLKALSVIGDIVLNWIKTKLVPLLEQMAPYIALALFGPALVRAVAGAVLGAAAGGILKLIKSFMLNKVGKQIEESAAQIGDKVKTAAEKLNEARDARYSKGGTPDQSPSAKIAAEAKKAEAGGKKTWKENLGPMAKVFGFVLAAGLAIAVAIAAMNAIMGDITPERAISLVIMMVGIAVAAIPLALSIKMLEKVIGDGGPGMLKSLGMMVGMLVVVGLVGALIAGLLSSIDSSTLLAAGSFMLSMSLVFLAMIPLLLAAGGLGMLLLTPIFGQVFGTAMVMGITALGLGLLAFTGMIISVLGQLASANFNAGGMKDKISAFVEVIKVFQPFAQTIADVVDELEDISEDPEDFAKVMGQVISFMTTLFGSSGQKTGIMGLIDTVMVVLEKFQKNEGLSGAARVFSDVMTGLTSALAALSPPPAFFDALTNWIGSEINVIAQARPWIEEMGKQLNTLVGTVLPLVDDLLSKEIPNTASVSALASMISGIGSLVGGLMPEPEFFEAFKETREESGLIIDSKRTFLNVDKLVKFMTDFFNQIGPLVTTMTSGVVSGILAAASQISPEKLEKLGTLADILKAVAELVKNLTSSSKMPNIGNVSAFRSTVNITNVIPDLGKLLDDVGGRMGTFVGQLTQAVAGIPADDKTFMQKLEAAKTMFSLIGEVTGLLDAVPKEEATEDKGKIPVSLHKKLLDSIDSINIFMEGMAGEKLTKLINNVRKLGEQMAPQRGQQPLAKILKPLAEFFTDLSSMAGSMNSLGGVEMISRGTLELKMGQISDNVTVVMSKIDSLKQKMTYTAVESVMTLGRRFKTFGEGLGLMSKSIEDGGIKTSLQAIGEVVDKVNGLNAALSETSKIDIATKLKVLANNIGLGQHASFEIKDPGKPVFQVNVHIQMGAKEMEQAILLRGDSVIRDRLNHATQNPDKKLLTTIPASGESLPQVPAPVVPSTT